MDGLLVLDKPAGPTCQKILSEFRRAYPKRKLGHTGTLDPFATGVLPVFIGEATKLIPYVEEETKTYMTLLSLGRATDTLDRLGETTEEASVPELSEDQVLKIFAGFLGQRLQVPPRYSAVKVQGTPLYSYARQGIDVTAAPRLIEVFTLELRELGDDFLRFETKVSRGTYIRSLGADIAEALGTVGHLRELRRLQSGPFGLQGSMSAADWSRALEEPQFLEERLRDHSEKLLKGFRRVSLKQQAQADRHRQGQTLTLCPGEFSMVGPPLKKGEKVLICLETEILSVSECLRWGNDQETLLKPLRILRLPVGQA